MIKNLSGIKLKTSIITISLLLSALLVTGSIATLSARGGIMRVAVRLLALKATELQKYMTSQWQLLVDNQLSDDEGFRSTAENAISSYAETLIEGDSELAFAFADTPSGFELALFVGNMPEVEENLREITSLAALVREQQQSWVSLQNSVSNRVGQYFFFAPFSWHVFFTESESVFMRDANAITQQTIVITLATILIGLLLNVVLVGYILKPIGSTVAVMKRVIEEGDFTSTVRVESSDELGQLAQTFNVMISELNTAYSQIKSYALHAVYAKRNESKVRNIFQKYVPTAVIDSIVERPETALVGASRELTIMFTDIRNFTMISEKYKPEKLVTALNKYFEGLVDIIVEHRGMIDKYIGDAIMAVFGAPIQQKNSPLVAVRAALEMQKMLEKFNKERQEQNLPMFLTGMGIAHGMVTVGNIGTEKKMDYTVIGDTVNYCSRLEGLNKFYRLSIIISESVCKVAAKHFPVRFVDLVQVRGKTSGERIFTIKASIGDKEKEALSFYHKGIELYYKKSFDEALAQFANVKKLLPDDHITNIFIERAKNYSKNPPPKDWKGIESTS